MTSKELNPEALEYMSNKLYHLEYFKELTSEERLDTMALLLDSITLYIEGCNICAITHNANKFKH